MEEILTEGEKIKHEYKQEKFHKKDLWADHLNM